MPPPTAPRRGRLAAAAALLALAACAPSEPTAAGADSAPAAAAPNPFDVGEAPRGLRIANPMDPERDYNFDLGRVPYGSVQVVDVQLENVEATPVTLRAVKPGCGCTVPSVSYTEPDGTVRIGDLGRAGDVLTIPPGHHADLRLEVDTRNVDKQNKSKRVLVRVTSEAEGSDEVFYLTLEVHLIVDVPFVAVPGRLDMKRVPVSGGGVAMVDITRANHEGLGLGEVVSAPEQVLTDLRHEQRFGLDVWTLSVRLVPPIPRGLFQGEVVMAVLDEEGQDAGRTFAVPVQALAVPDVEVVPRRLVFPERSLDRQPVARSELATLLPGHRLRVVDARVEGPAAPHLRLTVDPVDGTREGGSARWTIQLETLPTLDVPELEGEVVLEIDDPQFPEVRVAYTGTVRLDG